MVNESELRALLRASQKFYPFNLTVQKCCSIWDTTEAFIFASNLSSGLNFNGILLSWKSKILLCVLLIPNTMIFILFIVNIGRMIENLFSLIESKLIRFWSVFLCTLLLFGIPTGRKKLNYDKHFL